MIKAIDYKLKSIIHIDNKWCKVVNKDNNDITIRCNKCALFFSSLDICESIICTDYCRRDGTHIKFITV